MIKITILIGVALAWGSVWVFAQEEPLSPSLAETVAQWPDFPGIPRDELVHRLGGLPEKEGVNRAVLERIAALPVPLDHINRDALIIVKGRLFQTGLRGIDNLADDDAALYMLAALIRDLRFEIEPVEPARIYGGFSPAMGSKEAVEKARAKAAETQLRSSFQRVLRDTAQDLHGSFVAWLMSTRGVKTEEQFARRLVRIDRLSRLSGVPDEIRLLALASYRLDFDLSRDNVYTPDADAWRAAPEEYAENLLAAVERRVFAGKEPLADKALAELVDQIFQLPVYAEGVPSAALQEVKCQALAKLLDACPALTVCDFAWAEIAATLGQIRTGGGKARSLLEESLLRHFKIVLFRAQTPEEVDAAALELEPLAAFAWWGEAQWRPLVEKARARNAPDPDAIKELYWAGDGYDRSLRGRAALVKDAPVSLEAAVNRAHWVTNSHTCMNQMASYFLSIPPDDAAAQIACFEAVAALPITDDGWPLVSRSDFLLESLEHAPGLKRDARALRSLAANIGEIRAVMPAPRVLAPGEMLFGRGEVDLPILNRHLSWALNRGIHARFSEEECFDYELETVFLSEVAALARLSEVEVLPLRATCLARAMAEGDARALDDLFASWAESPEACAEAARRAGAWLAGPEGADDAARALFATSRNLALSRAEEADYTVRIKQKCALLMALMKLPRFQRIEENWVDLFAEMEEVRTWSQDYAFLDDFDFSDWGRGEVNVEKAWAAFRRVAFRSNQRREIALFCMPYLRGLFEIHTWGGRPRNSVIGLHFAVYADIDRGAQSAFGESLRKPTFKE